MSIFVTGDTHGGFQRFEDQYFPEQKDMSRNDSVIVCGDYTVKNIMPKPFILY